MDEAACLARIRKRLVIVVGVSLIAALGMFGATFLFGTHFMMSWYAFELGVLGGFVSIQQRLKRMKKPDKELLVSSWPSTIVAPVFGGVLALVLYLVFLTDAVEGFLFPEFDVPEFAERVSQQNIADFFRLTYPNSAKDFAKASLWFFIAGYSERFVPHLIDRIARKQGTNDE